MRKILVVEDEPLLLEMYDLILSSQPYEVFSADNGQAALDLCQGTTFDLILLDLMMPILNGVGFLERFLPYAPPHTRVIVLSNLSSGAEVDATNALGVERIVLKADLAPKQLISLIRYELDATIQE
jgi:two-component system chemotaxis response regulator CheY